jgi:hypothetical protein
MQLTARADRIISIAKPIKCGPRCSPQVCVARRRRRILKEDAEDEEEEKDEEEPRGWTLAVGRPDVDDRT